MLKNTILTALAFCFVNAVVPSRVNAQNTDRAPALATPGETPTVLQNPELVEHYQATITPTDLAARLYFLASDYFEGRETTTRGQKLAANYLASAYRKMGVEPKGTTHPANPMDPSSYFQPFPVYGSRMSSATLSVKRDGKLVDSSTYSASTTDDKAYLIFGTTPEVKAGVVFGGYGISDADLGYDDFQALKDAGIDVSDAWLLILADEPLASAEKSLLKTADGKPSQWTTGRFRKISAAAGSLQPKGILLIVDSSPRFEGSVGESAARSAAGLQGVGGLSLEPRTADSGGGRGRRSFPPTFAVSSEFANEILASTGKTVQQLQKQIDTSLKPVVAAISGVEVTGSVNQEEVQLSTENVAGFIEGSDPKLKNEYVVVSSHYDHIGMSAVPEGEDGINNGADDDGSGTVTVLEIAEAFAKAKEDGVGPRRSILFLNVTGEEKGLLGSAHYADDEPILPLENTVADLNIDMIGRIDPTHPGPNSDYVYIIGSNLISQELHEINQRVNDVTGIHLDLNQRFNSKDDPNQFYRRSDHWNFGKHNIPFIFFFTGTHEDYHRPGDEPQKIEYDRMARIGQMIFATAWQVANQDNRPAVSGTGFN